MAILFGFFTKIGLSLHSVFHSIIKIKVLAYPFVKSDRSFFMGIIKFSGYKKTEATEMPQLKFRLFLVIQFQYLIILFHIDFTRFLQQA